MHPRRFEPYLGEWMNAVSAGISAALEYDMEAWFYDEDKWPAALPGGMVPALGDAYRIKGLRPSSAMRRLFPPLG